MELINATSQLFVFLTYSRLRDVTSFLWCNLTLDYLRGGRSVLSDYEFRFDSVKFLLIIRKLASTNSGPVRPSEKHSPSSIYFQVADETPSNLLQQDSSKHGYGKCVNSQEVHDRFPSALSPFSAALNLG